jgi:DNA-binding transcriptional LysR family regulator
MNATIDLALLSVFVAVAEASSFSRAARALGTTTATVSRGLARLEALVGAELVHRTTRRVALSTAGQALYERTASHVGALQAAVRDLPERQEEPAGTLRLTAPYDLGVTLLGEVVARYVARYPQVRVDADFTSRRVDLVAEGFDLAIRPSAGLPRDSGLTVRRLLTGAVLGFFAAPEYLARRGVPRVVGAPDHEWISVAALGRQVEGLRAGQARIVANDFLFVREAARAGAGVGLLPGFVARPLVVAGELAPVLGTVKLPGGGLLLLYPASGQVARKVTAFRDLLVAALKRDWLE